MYGWSGQILKVDLTNERVVKEPLRSAFARDFLGGRGFNSKILYDEFNPKVTDPYSPQNIVVISPGSLVGATLSASRVCVSVARSPVTGLFGDGNLGSHWGRELKYAGYDTIVFYGKARELVYLFIEDDQVEIRDAKHLKGKTVWETEDMLKQELGDPEARVIAIGPAGENRVASAIPLERHRAAGGCGTGGVLGSKNMKAIIVRGTRGVKIARPEELKKAWKEVYNKLLNGPLYQGWSTYGSSWLTGIFNESGFLPTFNWQGREIAGIEQVDGPALMEKYHTKYVACTGCAVHCDHYYVVRDGPYAGTHGSGIEYEVLNGFGPRAGGTRLDAMLHINDLLNQLGLDVVQTANWLNVLRHWWQDGLIDETDTDGLDLEWGNYEATIEAIKKLAYREGFGNLLADNIFAFAEKISKKKGIPVEKLIRYIIQIKGMAQSSGDNRLHGPGSALSHGTSTRGSDHLRGVNTDIWIEKEKPEEIIGIPIEMSKRFLKLGLNEHNKYEGKAVYTVYMQNHCAIVDALGICKRHSPWEGQAVGDEEVAQYFNAVTGLDYTWKDLQKCGERIYNVERAMQARYGVRRKDDYPPVRYFEEPFPRGPAKGWILDKQKYDDMLTEYYELRGWDNEGIPKEKTLKNLELKDIADDLKKRKVIMARKKPGKSRKYGTG